MVTIKFKKINREAKIPKYANHGDAGMDVFSVEDYTLQPGERKTFGLGFQAEFPLGYVANFWDKSGLASNHGLTILGGVIDSGYRGEYKVILLNASKSPFQINKGDKIAQLLITPVEHATIEEVVDLEFSERGEGGFGSTGKQ